MKDRADEQLVDFEILRRGGGCSSPGSLLRRRHGRHGRLRCHRGIVNVHVIAF